MLEIWLYSILSIFIISLVSLIGIFFLAISSEKLKTILIYLVSFSAGALLADAFIHLLPEIIQQGFSLLVSFLILLGILTFFILEKVIQWHHCHMPITKEHSHPVAYMNLFGDGLHNFIDGLIIAGSYLVNIPTGIATTIAVLFHEIPQEIGDFGIMLHAGFSRLKALTFNFLSALTAALGAITALLLKDLIPNIEFIIVPLAFGAFIYIAGSDLIPEMHKETKLPRSIIQTLAFLLGIAVIASLLLLE
jgi:zinc and cadmium transporter